jgi:hypothetical protein
VKCPRVSLLILIVVLPLAVIGSFMYGFVTGETRVGPYRAARGLFEWSSRQEWLRDTYYRMRGKNPDPRDLPGSWQPITDRPLADSLPGKAQGNFQAVGYLSGYKPATQLKGVTAYVPERAYAGLNLVLSGHAQEALLVDMDGRVLHSWSYDFESAYPDFQGPAGKPSANPFFRDFWRRAHLYPNGDLLAIYDGYGMIRLDKDSNLAWSVSGGCHHDMFVDETGLIYVLTREAKTLPRYHVTRQVLEDFITVLDTEGNVLRKVSLLEAFERSSFASFLSDLPRFGDLFHTNTIQVLDGSLAHRSPIFRKGNILISVRNINVIAVVDLDTEKVIWALSGQWIAQHEPTLLPGGTILLFDNQGHRGMSKVIEIDPLSQEIVWAYEGTPDNGFYTESSGSVYRLPNGNTLIIQSNSGRVFEVTEDQQVVWEYYNPHRAGRNDELVATLFDVVRINPDQVSTWLRSP